MLGSVEEYLNVECPWQSACGGQGLESCYSLLSGDDQFSHFPSWVNHGLQERFECVGSANSCADYMACLPSESIFQRPVDSYSCPGDRENVCDSETQIFLWCLGEDSNPAESGTSPILVYELGPAGWSCDDGDEIADEPRVVCEQTAPFTCEGSMVQTCNANGNLLSYDCAQGHPDLVCGGAGERCGPSTRECEGNNINNSGGSAQCMGVDTAVICMNLKQYTVSCASAGAQCVNEGDYEASCVVI
jgi:hypothetical protein